MKDLPTELYQIVYEKPIYPKNLYDRGIWARPGALVP